MPFHDKTDYSDICDKIELLHNYSKPKKCQLKKNSRWKTYATIGNYLDIINMCVSLFYIGKA